MARIYKTPREYFIDIREVAFANKPKGLVDRLCCWFFMAGKMAVYADNLKGLKKEAKRLRGLKEKVICNSWGVPITSPRAEKRRKLVPQKL